MALTCDELRARIVDAKGRRNAAMVANATAENEGRDRAHTEADLAVMRLNVDMAALDARNAGCDTDDLVGPNVGNLD